MKKVKRYIVYSWIVLACFVAGQVMVYAHTHLIKYKTHQTSKNQQTITEKCQLCDAMHHNSMVLTDHQYFSPISTSHHFYKKGEYNFVSISLILAGGRSPPVS